SADRRIATDAYFVTSAQMLLLNPFMKSMAEVSPLSELVLIVEDDPCFREFLSASLEPQGFRVVTASNGVEGLRAVESEQPALVLFGMQMAVLDGLGFARELAERNQSIPTIAMSGDQDALAKAQTIGAHDCLTKPFGLTRLLSSVESALRAS